MLIFFKEKQNTEHFPRYNLICFFFFFLYFELVCIYSFFEYFSKINILLRQLQTCYPPSNINSICELINLKNCFPKSFYSRNTLLTTQYINLVSQTSMVTLVQMFNVVTWIECIQLESINMLGNKFQTECLINNTVSCCGICDDIKIDIATIN